MTQKDYRLCYTGPKLNVQLAETREVSDLMADVTKNLLSKIYESQQKYFEYALRNTATPVIKGKITKGKISWRGIRVVVKELPGEHESWLEQRGRRISPVIKVNASY